MSKTKCDHVWSLLSKREAYYLPRIQKWFPERYEMFCSKCLKTQIFIDKGGKLQKQDGPTKKDYR